MTKPARDSSKLAKQTREPLSILRGTGLSGSFPPEVPPKSNNQTLLQVLDSVFEVLESYPDIRKEQ